jgi:hypothetical protein
MQRFGLAFTLLLLALLLSGVMLAPGQSYPMEVSAAYVNRRGRVSPSRRRAVES